MPTPTDPQAPPPTSPLVQRPFPGHDPERCSPEAARSFVTIAAGHANYQGLVSTPHRVLVTLYEILQGEDQLVARARTYRDAVARERSAEAVKRAASAAEERAEALAERTLRDGDVDALGAAQQAHHAAWAELKTAQAEAATALAELLAVVPPGPSPDAAVPSP